MTWKFIETWQFDHAGKQRDALVIMNENYNNVLTGKNAKVNARLIAAAPELLEVLKTVRSAVIALEADALGWSYTDNQQRYSLRDELLSNISRAIDDAEGGK